jgi:RNA polymerase sigma-70 factor (ECF subfamily)
MLTEPLRAVRSTAEATLIEGLRRGDEDSYEDLIRQHAARMLATARRLLRNDDDARDVVQDALLSAFRTIDQFNGASKLSTWLHRIVVNAALMKMRTRRRKPEHPIDELLPRFDEQGEWIESPSGWNDPAEVLLQRRETRVTVRACIDRLPETYRTVLLLRDIEELDTDEVASQLEITPTAVKVRLHRARQALRTLLERELHEPRP